MKIQYVNLKAQWQKEKNKLIPIIGEVLKSGNYIGGKEIERFEQNIAKVCNTKYAVALNSGTDALTLGLYLLGVRSGDEVITPPNSFIASTSTIVHIGAKPVFVKTNKNKQYEPDFSDLRKKINNKTKGIIINSPSNPTGGVWSDSAIIDVLDLCKNKNIWIFSDECYEQLVYDNKFKSIASLTDQTDRILTFQSCSKTYAMTGWRIGYTIGDPTVIKGMSKLQGQSTSCPNSIAQYAAIEALQGNQDCVSEMVEIFKFRRNLILEEIKKNDKITCKTPNGAFYVFPNLSYYLGSRDSNGKIMKSSEELSLYILNETGVVTVAGQSFGVNDNIRISYATSEDIIKKAIQLINESLSKLNF